MYHSDSHFPFIQSASTSQTASILLRVTLFEFLGGLPLLRCTGGDCSAACSCTGGGLGGDSGGGGGSGLEVRGRPGPRLGCSCAEDGTGRGRESG